MLKWMCGHTLKNWIRKKNIREDLGVIDIEYRMRENSLRWFGHVQRISIGEPVRNIKGQNLEILMLQFK